MYKKSLLVLSVGLFSTSIFAQSASGDAVRQKMEDLQRRGTESRQQPTLQINPPIYQLNPKLKNAPKKDATVDQYDCDSTCANMDNTTSNKSNSYVENQFGKCPDGYQNATGKNYYVSKTRTATNNYTNGVYTGVSYSGWIDQSFSCSQIENRVVNCPAGYTGSKTERRNNIYNQNGYQMGAWTTIKDTCAPPPSSGGGVYYACGMTQVYGFENIIYCIDP